MLLSLASLQPGVPKFCPYTPLFRSSAGQLATTGAALSITVMVWLQVVELLCASVAVQVQIGRASCREMTGKAWSAKVTVKLVSQASLKSGVPKAGVAGHSML